MVIILNEGFGLRQNQQGFALVIIIGIVAATLITSAGTVVVSNSSKPGDALYSIDRASEKLQLALALTDGRKKEIYAGLAAERLNELEALYEEDELDTEGVNHVLNDYDEHMNKLVNLADDDGNLDDHEQELEKGLESRKTDIDKTAESQQKSLESQREDLKKQYEQALKDGDTAKAAVLNAQIDSFEDILKSVEENRETLKQEAEEQSEAEKKAEEERLEAEKKTTETH